MEQSLERYIVGHGETLWDMLPEGRKIGGAPANFIHHIAQFDLPSCLVSAVGDDELGAEIRSIFEKKNIRTVIPTVPFPTGTVEVTLNDEGVPQYDICEGVAWDNIPFTDELRDLATKTVAVCFGTLAQRNEVSRQTIKSFIEAMDDESIKICDVNLRGDYYSREVVEWSVIVSDVVKVNDEELPIICELLEIPHTDPEQVAQYLYDHYDIEMLILTCGAEGSHVYSLYEPNSSLGTPKVEVVDTVGAGDAFTGSFIAAMMSGFEVKWAHRLAVEVAAYVCTQPGAMPDLPDEMRERVI